MAFNYINGIQVGAEASAPPYGYGVRQFRRMLWNWLHKVVGWQDIEKSGANLDNPELGPITDGATDASNTRRFTSATGGFTSAMEQSHLLIHPTAAPATAGGFSDATKNGWYEIRRVYDSNTIDVEIFNGVHTDGLPLSESGLRFEVHRLRDVGNLIADTNYFVLRGTGTGGTFDMKFTENYAVNYAPTRIICSPWADWVAGAPGSFSPSTRITTETLQAHAFNADVGWIWAIADLTQCIVWARFWTSGFAGTDSMFMYMGDISPFHGGSDPRPVVVAHGGLGGSFDEYPSISHNVRMVAPDDTTQVTSRVGYLAHHGGDATAFNGFTVNPFSFHSGRLVRAPLIVFEETAGNEEIRGQLKNVDMMNFYGARGPIPIGTSRDRIRFFTQFTAPWNGSKIHRYVF